MGTDYAGPRTAFRTVDGLRIRCAESSVTASPWIVLTSPWPESLHAFGRVWPALAATARLLAVDLPGFGLSDRRADLLSPRAMGEFVVRFLDEWGIAEPHLVAPDVGTSAALFAAADHPDASAA